MCSTVWQFASMQCQPLTRNPPPQLPKAWQSQLRHRVVVICALRKVQDAKRGFYLRVACQSLAEWIVGDLAKENPVASREVKQGLRNFLLLCTLEQDPPVGA